MYAKAADRLLKHDPPIRIAKTDATVHIESARKYNIEGYPTLKFFTSGVPNEFTGVKNEEGIVSWLVKRIDPPAKILENQEQLEGFIDLHPVSVVLFGGESQVVRLFEKVAKNLEGNFYAVCNDLLVAKKFVQDNAIVVFKDKENRKSEFFGPFVESEINKFIEKNLVPWILPFDDRIVQLVFKKQNPGLFIFRKEKDSSSFQETLETLSNKLKGYPIVTYADLESSNNKRLVEFLGLPANWMPFAVIVNEKFQKFILRTDLSLSSLESFWLRWTNNEEKPFLKSQPIPSSTFDNDVRILVGDNFKDIVFDRNFDVLVEFYAPWCGHCKKIAPEYTKLAKRFKGVSSVVIGKIDATENEIENFDIQEFPTIKFFPANNKDGIDFIGKKDVDGLERFVLDNAALPIRKEEL
jgi:protein disulfide-isomerase A1